MSIVTAGKYMVVAGASFGKYLATTIATIKPIILISNTSATLAKTISYLWSMNTS